MTSLQNVFFPLRKVLLSEYFQTLPPVLLYVLGSTYVLKLMKQWALQKHGFLKLGNVLSFAICSQLLIQNNSSSAMSLLVILSFKLIYQGALRTVGMEIGDSPPNVWYTANYIFSWSASIIAGAFAADLFGKEFGLITSNLFGEESLAPQVKFVLFLNLLLTFVHEAIRCPRIIVDKEENFAWTEEFVNSLHTSTNLPIPYNVLEVPSVILALIGSRTPEEVPNKETIDDTLDTLYKRWLVTKQTTRKKRK